MNHDKNIAKIITQFFADMFENNTHQKFAISIFERTFRNTCENNRFFACQFLVTEVRTRVRIMSYMYVRKYFALLISYGEKLNDCLVKIDLPSEWGKINLKKKTNRSFACFLLAFQLNESSEAIFQRNMSPKILKYIKI